VAALSGTGKRQTSSVISLTQISKCEKGRLMQLHMVISSIQSARMDSDQVKVDKIVAFADKGRKLEKHYDENPLDSDAIQSYNRRVENTIRSLQEHVKRQEYMLRQVSNATRTRKPMRYSLIIFS
jgi:hypothetical protein